jgi:hypothetical protein
LFLNNNVGAGFSSEKQTIKTARRGNASVMDGRRLGELELDSLGKSPGSTEGMLPYLFPPSLTHDAWQNKGLAIFGVRC